MYTPVDVIEVRIWGHRVGAIALDPRLGYYAFEYAPAFTRSGVELAPMTMPLVSAREPFIFTSLPEATYHRLPAMVADALPDDFGNSLVDAWMATQGVEKSAITPLDRLAYMGKRSMGALEFKPVRGPSAPSTAVELSQLIEGARRAVHGEIGTDADAHAALMQIIQVGTSAGGARAKAAIAWNPTTQEIRTGQFDVSSGFEHWLLKFDGMGPDQALGTAQGHGRVEYAYSLMAAAAGIRMSPSRLLEEHGRAHFMTKRFDRAGNVKHHVQTLCAMAQLDFKQKATHDLSQIFLTMRQLHLGYADMEDVFRRAVFNVMAANYDNHTKNLSFLLREGGAWELAPAYDVTHAFNPKSEWTHQLLMSVNGKFAGVDRDDFARVADQFGIGTAPQVITQVREAVNGWSEYAATAQLNERETARIRGHHRVL